MTLVNRVLPVSITIPIFNGERFLGVAIESILKQEFEAFELLLIDDGSTDRSLEIAHSYTDPRIRVIANRENRGIPRTQTLALSEAAGRYFGILDQDDIADPRRLSRQVAFLESEPKIAAVGAWFQAIDQSGTTIGRVKTLPTDPLRIACSLLFFSAMHQPVVTARTEILRRYGYRSQFPICADYDLWTRLSADHRVANLPEVLAFYRQGNHQTSKTRAKTLAENTMSIQRELLIRLGLTPTASDVSNHFRIPRKKRFGISCDVDGAYLEWLSGWIEALKIANEKSGLYDRQIFSDVLGAQWRGVLRRALKAGRILPALRHALSGPQPARKVNDQ